MKTINIISIFLGSMSLLFGVLKFADPFKTWYSVQIESSGLPDLAFALGIGGELITGAMFLFPFVLSSKNKAKFLFLTLANSSLIILMTAATIVHLIPEVPANVLPLKLKTPIIPLMFLTVAILNQINVTKKALPLNNETFR